MIDIHHVWCYMVPWQVKSDVWRVTGKVWHIKSVISRVSCHKWHVKGYMSREICQEWHVKNDKLKSKVTYQSRLPSVKNEKGTFVKSEMSKVSYHGGLSPPSRKYWVPSPPPLTLSIPPSNCHFMQLHLVNILPIDFCIMMELLNQGTVHVHLALWQMYGEEYRIGQKLNYMRTL